MEDYNIEFIGTVSKKSLIRFNDILSDIMTKNKDNENKDEFIEEVN